MPYNINQNDMINQINSMFGPNAYQNRISQINNVESLKSQLKQAQTNYNSRLKAHNGLIKQQQAAAKKAAAQAKAQANKKTYVDAVDELAGHVMNSNDAAKMANEIRNDPTKQQAIKDQGYTVTDYINALYNASSNGKYRSEREYKQAEAQKKKQASDPLAGLNTQTKQQPKQSGGIGGFLGNIGHDLQTAYADVVTKPVSAIANAIDSGVKAKHDIKSGKRKKPESLSEIKNALVQGYNSQTPVSFQKVLSDMGSKNKTVNKLVGGASDFALNPLNLIPYGAAEAGLSKLGLESGIASKLGNGVIGKSIGKGIQGGAVGALGTLPDALLNPNGGSVQDRAKEIGQMALLGGIPGLGLGALEGGSKVINNALDKRIIDMLPKNVLKTDLHASPQGYQDVLNTKALPAPSKYNVVNTPLGIDTLQSNEVKNALNDLHSNYNQKMNDSVNQALDHAKNTFVGQGMQKYLQKSYELEASKTLASDYKKIRSAFPKGIKVPEGNRNDFQLPNAFKAKSGSAVDIYQAAEQMGFKTPDEFIGYLEKLDQANKLAKTSKKQVLGFSTPEHAQKNLTKQFNKNVAPNVKSKLSELFHQTPDAQAIKSSIEHLNNVKGQLDTTPTGVMQNRQTLNYVGNIKNPIATRVQSVDPNAKPIEPLAQLKQTLKQVAPTKQFENITAAEPKLKKLTKSELIKEKNLEQFKANNLDPTIPDTKGQIVSKLSKPKEPFIPLAKYKADQAYINNVDNLHRLQQFTKDVKSINGGTLEASKDPFKLAQNSRSTDMVASQIISQNMVDKNGDVIGIPLTKIIKGVPKGKEQDFLDYIINKYAVTRMKRGEKVFKDELKMSPEKSQAIVKAYEKNYPKFEEIAKKYYDFNKQLGEGWLVKGGLIPKDVFESYRNENPYYVSNERYFSALEKSNPNKAKSGFSGQNNQIKKATGSQRPIINPFETSVERVDRYTKAVKRNEVMQVLIHHLKLNPEELKGWAEIVPSDKNKETYQEMLQNKLKNEGMDGVIEEFNKPFDQKPDLTHGNIVRGIVDGKEVHVKIHDPQLLDALTNLTPKALDGAFEVARKVTRTMKTLTTGINPFFSLFRNVWRDIPQAYINSKTTDNPITFTKDIVSAIIDVFGNRESHQAFKNIGGGHSSSVASDINLLGQSMRKISHPDMSLKERLKRGYERGISAVESFSNAVESAPRLAEYKRITKGKNDYASKMEGLFQANDVTVNFNRYGNNVKKLDAIIPYLNASVQGLDKFVRVYKDNPKAAIAKSIVAVSIPSAIAFAWNFLNDYQGYKDLPAYDKDTNLLLSTGDGRFIKIPRTREVGMVFGALPERLFQQFAERDPLAFRGFATSLLDNFVPSSRFITSPLNDIRANKDFANRPIVPGNMQGLSPRYQYDEKTSGVSKFIGNQFNLSPKKLDYLAKSYTGIVGQLGIPATSSGGGVGGVLSRQLTADSVYSNDKVSQFYDMLNKLDTAKKDYNAVGVQGKYFNEPLRKVFDSTSRQMAKVRKATNQVQSDPSLTNQQKQEQLRQLQKIINSLASQALSKAR